MRVARTVGAMKAPAVSSGKDIAFRRATRSGVGWVSSRRQIGASGSGMVALETSV